MRYLLVNVTSGNLQINLYSPEVSHRNKSLHRPGPSLALNLKRGESIDLLKHYKSVAAARAALKNSKDTLAMLKPGVLHEVAYNDKDEQVDPDVLVTGQPIIPAAPEPPPNVSVPAGTERAVEEPKSDPDVTMPDMGLGQEIAAQHEFEERKKIVPEPMAEETSDGGHEHGAEHKSSKKNKNKKK